MCWALVRSLRRRLSKQHTFKSAKRRVSNLAALNICRLSEELDFCFSITPMFTTTTRPSTPRSLRSTLPSTFLATNTSEANTTKRWVSSDPSNRNTIPSHLRITGDPKTSTTAGSASPADGQLWAGLNDRSGRIRTAMARSCMNDIAKL